MTGKRGKEKELVVGEGLVVGKREMARVGVANTARVARLRV